jgi:CheY-like chemotaxis protein
MKKLNCILLIEDNDFINIYNRRVIEQLNLVENIEIVEDGQEGLDYLMQQGKFAANGHAHNIPDLILLDLNMPRVNGWEFMQEFQKIKNTINKRIVIIVLSTSPNPDDIKRSEDICDIAAFVSKPLTREVLGKLIEKHFS